MFKQVDQNYNAFSEGWPKAIRPIRNSVNTGPTVFVYELTKQKRQCIKGNNQICLTIGQIQNFTSFY